MSVAKSFQDLERVGEPFEENGREYIYVICKNGNKRKVRWYPEANTNVFTHFNARHAFGFYDAGYITIYKGSEAAIREWRKDLPYLSIWNNDWFGFYSPSSINLIPPPDIIAIRLNWDEIKVNDTEMRDGPEVQAYVLEKLHGHSNSQYQGQKDEWIVRKVVIKDNTITTTHYGETHIHTMEDADGNQYVWSTASKDLPQGQFYTIKMKVKGHQDNKGIKQTLVYYCKVI